MKKTLKLYEKWQNKAPRQAARKDVELVISEFFGNSWRHHKSSHIVVYSEKLINVSPGNAMGEISIPVKGSLVKGFYIVRLIKAINIVFEDREDEDET
jgi:hypothetical protein